ncbi:MAG: nuclear transport factor 2 family protein [Thermoleophilia bacterium]
MTTTQKSVIDIINRSHHRREPEPLLDLLADDAELVTYDKGGAEPRTTSGRPAIEEELREVFARDMTHEVQDMVAGEGRIAYRVHCLYPDGTRVVGSVICELDDAGHITRMTQVVTWDD